MMMESAASARPDDEEARHRRSTDCIYFLASPLTCKKGSECEYRHSDAARMNPRDCWYWFNGNCSNPKCSFRHPPLDNLLGASETPRAAQQSASQVPVPAQSHGSSSIPSSGTGTAKQGVPCYYFQNGMCAKGDRCTFLHVPQAAGNSAPQPMQKVFTSALQPIPQLKNSWTKPNSSAQQKTTSSIFAKSKVNAHGGQKQNLTRRVDHSSRIYQKHINSDVQSGSAKHYQPQPSVEVDIAENGVEVGEFVREPSAGSGVLVGSIDCDPEQSLKGNHNNYHRTRSGEQHTDTGMRQTRGSHEPEMPYRSSGETLLSDKRISQRESMNVTAGSSDLRHRLLKQRRLSNPRSTQMPDRHDAYLEERHRWRGNEHAAHDGLTRSRLHGRVKLPGGASFDRLGSRSEREKDSEPGARLSPPKHTDLRGKLHERLKARSNEDIPDNAKSSVKKASTGEDAGSLNFAGPKSLAELKANKVVGSSGEDAISSSTSSFVGLARRIPETVGSRDSSESVPFEGPKPLSVILKRKREATSADSGSIQEEEEPAGVEGESQNELQILESGPVEVNMEANGEEEEEEEDDMAYNDNLSPADGNAVEDGGRELDDNLSQDLDAAQDYEYDAADMNADEDNDYQEYEDDDDLEDDDDFARKVGVMIS